MSQSQIDATRFVLRTLRWVDATWRSVTRPAPPKPPQPPADRREPPKLW
ncbi:MAG: hypothetical protein WAL91_12910 [Propionicimonas sp.]